MILLDWNEFEYVTKVDPAKRHPEPIDVLRHVDAVIVDGSDGATEENSLAVSERLRAEFPDPPLVQEPCRSAYVSKRTVEATNAVFVPVVYNGDKTNFVEKHAGFLIGLARKSEDVTRSGLPFAGSVLAPKGRKFIDDIVDEGYVIQSPDSRVAGLTNVEEHCTPKQAADATLATELFHDFPISYIEYSKRHIGPEGVSVVVPFLDETTLPYGGSIRSRVQTDGIFGAGADAVVVGNCPHEGTERLLETIPTT